MKIKKTNECINIFFVFRENIYETWTYSIVSNNIKIIVTSHYLMYFVKLYIYFLTPFLLVTYPVKST